MIPTSFHYAAYLCTCSTVTRLSNKANINQLSIWTSNHLDLESCFTQIHTLLVESSSLRDSLLLQSSLVLLYTFISSNFFFVISCRWSKTQIVSREKLIARKLSLSLAVAQHFCGIEGVFGRLSRQVNFFIFNFYFIL
jgi:hypothetical protein